MGSESYPADSPSVVVAVARHALDHALHYLDPADHALLTTQVKAWLASTERTINPQRKEAQ